MHVWLYISRGSNEWQGGDGGGERREVEGKGCGRGGGDLFDAALAGHLQHDDMSAVIITAEGHLVAPRVAHGSCGQPSQ